VIDIGVRRNAFGRQLDSFETDLQVSGVDGGPVHAVFIRAPVVSRVGDGVDKCRRPNYEAMDMPSNGSAPHTSHCQIPLGNRNPYF